jgi:hypothetical protein
MSGCLGQGTLHPIIPRCSSSDSAQGGYGEEHTMDGNGRESHGEIALSQWNKLEQLIGASNEGLPVTSLNGSGGVRLNGRSLDLASVVAVSRYPS